MSSTSLAMSSRPAPGLAARVAARARLHLALVAASVTLVVAWSGLVLTHEPPHLALSRSVAMHAVLSDPGTARMLRAVHWTALDVTPMDNHYEELGFYRGARMVATITLGVAGRHLFLDATDLTRQRYAYGSNIANDVRVLAMLSALFILMTAVWPLWRLRNLDVLVATSTVLSVVLFNQWTLARMVMASYPAMLYLALRCAWQALGSRSGPRPSVPLYEHLTRGWTDAQRLRSLRLVAVALVLITVMVGLTSLHVLDVGYAVMEGATAVVHGLLPYGHIPDILHGDTYPIGSYLLYTPFAWLSPVYSAWDDADLTLAVAVVAAVVAAAGIWRMTVQAGSPASRSPAAQRDGLRAAIAVLAFPPMLVTVSTGTTDVALAAMLVAAFALWHRPGWGSAVLSGAAWFKVAPLSIMPMLFARLRGGELIRAIAALLITSAIMVAVLVGLGGFGGVGEMLGAISFQFTRASPHTLWAVVGSVPLQQLAEAATLALVVGAALRVRRDRALAGDRVRLAAIAAATLLGVQISANYWNYMYLVWAMPFIALGLIGPVRSRDPTVASGMRR
jgi:Glycosyltransferase family 87